MLLTLHLLALGIWIGVVGAEFVIEFDGMNDDESAMRAAKMHYLTDLWVEAPAFTVVLVTGLLMLGEQQLSGLFLYKVIFGVLAVVFNSVCVVSVFRRRKYALLGDVENMHAANELMKVGALVIPTFMVAFALSMYFVWAG